MKNFWSNLSLLTRVVLASALAGLVLVLLSIFTIFLGYPGWTIGIAIGAIIGVAIAALQLVGGNATASGKKPGITFLFYFLRIILLAAGLVIPAILEKKLGVECMKFASFGAGIGYIPSIFTLVIVLMTNKEEDEE